ncbi:MAG: ATP-binding protein, partial [Limisphaerales bacterium]
MSELLVSPGLEPAQQARRIHQLERDIILPIKAVLIVTLFYYFYFSQWFDQARISREVALETISKLFLIYIGVNIVAGTVIIFVRHFSLTAIQWTVFALGLLDGLLLASLTLVTGGFESVLYWLFLGLIIHN